MRIQDVIMLRNKVYGINKGLVRTFEIKWKCVIYTNKD